MFVDVALPLPLFRTFTYCVPDEQRDRARVGMRAVVPFRSTTAIGVIVGEGAAREGIKPKPVKELPDTEPVIGERVLALCKWLAEYYVVPLGVAVRTALPVALAGATEPTPSQKTRRVATIVRQLDSLMRRDNVFARVPKQRALFELVESLGGRVA